MVRPEIKKKMRERARAAVQSRKAQKKLEKIVLHKKSKVNRSNLLAELKKYQIQPDQLELLHSTSAMQTKGLKRFITDVSAPDSRKVNEIDRAEKCLDAAILLKRKRRKVLVKSNQQDVSSSEDTDDFSTDTEIYEYSDVEGDVSDTQKSNQDTKENGSILANSPSKSVVKKDDDNNHNPKEIKTTSEPRQPAVFVQVSRSSEIQEARLKLPITGEEQQIMEKIRYNNMVIISGETGSGKTTQLPQFLYEAGYALNNRIIGITEPRRVAAISMSERVAQELNLGSEEVSYQIRFSGNATPKTCIKFMTDGVLLRECQKDFLLSKYSVIIIDEAHERSVFSDILIGLLSRIVPLRSKRQDPLKLIIMSATLRVDDFLENPNLFKIPPPMINIEARQFPVSVQFAKKTPENYLQAAYRKVCSIHSKMPKGGILVFVTSQMDVKVLCNKLRDKFSGQSGEANDWSEAGTESSSDESVHCSQTPLHCLGLFAMLPLEKQRLVFKDPPEGSRLCVVATNVAETSITIPNIRYVVDTGLEKTKQYDLVTGISKFVTTWTSKSSAEQRKGRAGRMGPGQCYRLYSSAVYANDFPDFAEPQILQRPVEDVVLRMKSMNIDNVVNFPFPTRPSIEALQAAEKKLILLRALDDSKIKEAGIADLQKLQYTSRLTPLGKAMSRFTISARCSKMLVLSSTELLPYVICLVSALTVREMFLEGNKWRDLKKKWLGRGSSRLLGDFMIMVRAVIIAENSDCSTKKCLENGLRPKAILEIDKLRRQLTQEVNKNLKHNAIDYKQKLNKPNESQADGIRQLLLASYCDHIAIKVSNKTYECQESEEPVYISSESMIKGQHPEKVIYKELYKSDKRTYMRDVAVIAT